MPCAAPRVVIKADLAFALLELRKNRQKSISPLSFYVFKGKRRALRENVENDGTFTGGRGGR